MKDDPMLASEPDNVILEKEEPVLPGMVLNLFPSIELEAKKKSIHIKKMFALA